MPGFFERLGLWSAEQQALAGPGVAFSSWNERRDNLPSPVEDDALYLAGKRPEPVRRDSEFESPLPHYPPYF